MFKYFHIIKFLMTHDLTFLKECWQFEFIKDKKFTWIRIITRSIKRKNKYLFWWRLASEMYNHGNESEKSVANKINDNIMIKYNTEIGMGAKIGKGLCIMHYSGIVIINKIVIGENFCVGQNTTLGNGYISIGDNVYVGVNSCIISRSQDENNPLNIGNNVRIGAMTFINKDIPDNCTVYTEKANKIIIETH